MTLSHGWKHKPWVCNCERNRSHRNHRSIQRQKYRLIPHSRITPTTRHLWDTVYAPYEDSGKGEADSPTEDPESQWTPDMDIVGQCRCIQTHICSPLRLRFEFCSSLPPPYKEVGNNNPTYRHRNRLQCNPRNNQCISGRQQRWIRTVLRSRRHTPSNRLHDNTPQITTNEYPWIPSRLQPRILRPAIKHHMLQRQIYARSEETRREHQTADLYLEAGSRPWVLVHDEAPNVAGHFTKCTNPDGEHECPCSRPCSDDELRDEQETEEGGKEGIRA